MLTTMSYAPSTSDVAVNLAFNDEQLMIRDAAADYLVRASDSAAVRSAMVAPAAWDPAVWQVVAQELGWCGVAVGEAHGGLGLGPVELSLLQEQAGRRLLCAPFLSSGCLAVTVLNECADSGLQDRLLPGLAAGQCQLAVPLATSAAGWTGDGVSVAADGSLSGTVSHLAWGATAQAWLVPAREDGAVAWYLIDQAAEGADLQALESWDLTRPMTQLQLKAARGERIASPTPQQADRALALARLYLAAEQLGGAQQCLDMTLAYLAERHQFGRPLASFQALKHRCAELMVQVEAARSAVYGAAFAAAGDADIRLDCAAARMLAGEAFQRCAGEAIQLHGGVGFTWEYDPQLYFKRAWASRYVFGDASALRALIATDLLADP